MTKMKIKVSIVLVVMLLSSPAYADKTCINKVCFPNTDNVSGDKLDLIGVAKFRYLLFDVYTLGLYGPKGISSKKEILNNIPKKLVFKYHREISKEVMIEGANKNLKKSQNAPIETFIGELEKINQSYQNVKENDVYELAYSPSIGTSLTLNKNKKVTIKGKDFAKYYFGIWLSENPISLKLRNELLKEID